MAQTFHSKLFAIILLIYLDEILYHNVAISTCYSENIKQIYKTSLNNFARNTDYKMLSEIDVNLAKPIRNKNETNNDPLLPENSEDFIEEPKDLLNDLEFDHNEEEATITELVTVSNSGDLTEENHNSTVRIAFGIILRLVLPLANGVVRSIRGIRDVRFLRVLRSLASSRQALTHLFAFAANTLSLNLSAVQVSYRMEPILKLLKIRKSQDGVESLPDTSSPFANTPGTSSDSQCDSNFSYSPLLNESPIIFPSYLPMSNKRKEAAREQEQAPKCCTLNIMAEPPPGQPIRADIVFIHGLHGSQVNTWKQGLWEKERQPENFQRPPKPPVRPPKRPRHSRTLVLKPPHKKKRARFAHTDLHRQSTERDTHDDSEEGTETLIIQGDHDEFSYLCGEPEDIKFLNGIEYSFPDFRVRINDTSRLLTTDIEKMFNDDKYSAASSCNQSKDSQNKEKKKLTPDDPNYSKCWPGDWLPMDCPGVRVIALNYTTDPYLWRPLWKKKEPRSNLVQRSREMAELLVKNRVGYGHPIIWVGHSKGGLFVKQIIVDAWESGKPSMAPFWRSARGAFFYSVPHRGSHLASIKAPLLARSVELIDIEKNNKYLLDLHRRFVCLYHMGHLKIEVFSFVETALTLMSVLYLRIVGVDSADPGIGDVCGIRLDHREICKPRSRDCILYKELLKMVKKVC